MARTYPSGNFFKILDVVVINDDAVFMMPFPSRGVGVVGDIMIDSYVDELV
jgi:hypothetical protein